MALSGASEVARTGRRERSVPLKVGFAEGVGVSIYRQGKGREGMLLTNSDRRHHPAALALPRHRVIRLRAPVVPAPPLPLRLQPVLHLQARQTLLANQLPTIPRIVYALLQHLAAPRHLPAAHLQRHVVMAHAHRVPQARGVCVPRVEPEGGARAVALRLGAGEGVGLHVGGELPFGAGVVPDQDVVVVRVAQPGHAEGGDGQRAGGVVGEDGGEGGAFGGVLGKGRVGEEGEG